MDHLELIEAQLTKEGMLAYDSIEEASIAAFQEMILFQRRAYFQALHDRYSPGVIEDKIALITVSQKVKRIRRFSEIKRKHINRTSQDCPGNILESSRDCPGIFLRFIGIFAFVFP